MTIKQHEFQVEFIDSQGLRYPVTLLCETESWNEGKFSKRTCSISTAVRGKEISCSDRDFFEAFCRVREQLENEGLNPLCYGASRNVFPSGMLRDMANGLQAYRLVMGKHVGPGDAVSIFEIGPDVEPASVQDQADFFRQWLKSTKS